MAIMQPGKASWFFVRLSSALTLIAAVAATAPAMAQVSAVGSNLLIPVVVASGSFQSDIFVRNVADTSQTVNIAFHEAVTSSTPGTKTCTALPLNAYEVARFSLATQCTLPVGSHHGFMTIENSSVNKDKLLQAYVRTANPFGIGFSVEAYPIGHIGGGSNYSEVLGLKRAAATMSTPAYQSNCFVATLDDPVDYQIQVYSGLGNGVINGTLLPFQMRRYLDVFAAAGVPTGDVDDRTVTVFVKTNSAQSSHTLISFCTVQDNTSFGADFRIAKSFDGADPSRLRTMCYGTLGNVGAQGCSSNLNATPPTLFNLTVKDRWLTMLYAPDTVRCTLAGPRVADLEIQLVESYPTNLVAGGNQAPSFTYITPKRSATNFGNHQNYWIEVSFREGGANILPIPYGINCTAGNGMAALYFLGTPPDDF